MTMHPNRRPLTRTLIALSTVALASSATMHSVDAPAALNQPNADTGGE